MFRFTRCGPLPIVGSTERYDIYGTHDLNTPILTECEPLSLIGPA